MKKIIELVLMALLTISTYEALNYAIDHYSVDASPPTPIVEVQKPKDSLASIIDQVEKLPDGPFKRNMFTIIGTEYAGDSVKLNKMLQKYSEEMIKQLEKGISM
jgi:hypothetical protein